MIAPFSLIVFASQKRVIFCVVWLIAAGAGFGLILRYQNAAGSAGLTPDTWPEASGIKRVPGANTLVMFAHPQCPCSRASVEELNRVLTHGQGKVRTQVWFFRPSEAEPEWTDTDLWRSAAAIPGVSVHADSDGIEASRFGAETSGHVVYYDGEGKLLFQGGITGGRGHAGDNPGESALRTLLQNQEALLRKTAVYGCSLLTPCPPPAP